MNFKEKAKVELAATSLELAVIASFAGAGAVVGAGLEIKDRVDEYNAMQDYISAEEAYRQADIPIDPTPEFQSTNSGNACVSRNYSDETVSSSVAADSYNYIAPCNTNLTTLNSVEQDDLHARQPLYDYNDASVKLQEKQDDIASHGEIINTAGIFGLIGVIGVMGQAGQRERREMFAK